MTSLGAMLLSRKGAAIVQATLKAEDFYRPAHQEIFRACCALMASGTELDLVTLPNRLDMVGKMAEVGGIEYLIQVAEAVPSAHNAEYYAQIVLDMANLRRILEHAKFAYRTTYDETLDPSEKVNLVQDSASSLRTGEKFAFDAHDLLMKAKDRPKWAIPTGFDGFDRVTNRGGMGGGKVHLVGGETGQGKTWLACQMIRTACDLGHRVCLVSLEMDGQDMMDRIVQQRCGHEDRSKACETHEEGAWDEAAQEIYFWEMQVVDGSMFAQGLTVESLVSWLWAEHQTRAWKMVVVDYAQLLESSAGIRDEWRQLKHVGNLLRLFAMRSGAVVLLIVQIDKDERGKYQVRGSRDLEKQAASFIILDRATGDEKKERPDYIYIRKNRFGRSKHKFAVEHQKPYFKFVPTTETAPSDSGSVYRGGE